MFTDKAIPAVSPRSAAALFHPRPPGPAPWPAQPAALHNPPHRSTHRGYPFLP